MTTENAKGLLCFSNTCTCILQFRL